MEISRQVTYRFHNFFVFSCVSSITLAWLKHENALKNTSRYYLQFGSHIFTLSYMVIFMMPITKSDVILRPSKFQIIVFQLHSLVKCKILMSNVPCNISRNVLTNLRSFVLRNQSNCDMCDIPCNLHLVSTVK